MRTKITHLKLINFRNIPEFEIDFKDGYNEISGENGVGKTTILTAITYALFGKDIFNKKQFSILPIINGIEQKDMTSTVELTIDNNFIVSRSWDGNTTEVKTGFIEENGKVNLVKCTQVEFKRFLEEHFVDEDEFKSLSNINYLPNLHWKELKEFIFKLIGEITDEDVLLNGSFPLIEEFVKKMGIERLSKNLSDTKKELNEEIKKLETESNYAVQMKLKYVNDGKKNEEMIARKEVLEKQIQDWYSLKEIEDKKRQTIVDLENRIKTIEYELIKNKTQKDNNIKMIENLNELYKQNSFNVENMRQEEISKLKSERMHEVLNLNNQKALLDQVNKRIEEIKVLGNEEKAREVKIENSKCSTCGQELPKEIQEKTLEKLKKEQLEKLQSLMNELNENKSKASTYENNISGVEDRINIIDSEIKKVETKEYPEVEETEKQKEIKVRITSLENDNAKIDLTYNDLTIKLEENKKALEQAEQPKELEPIYVSQAELKEINEKLSTTITLQALEDEISAKNKALNEAKEEKELLFQKEQEVVKFNDLKAELLKSKIKQHFDYVEFITKEETKQGDLVETFELSHNGIKYNELNSAMKIIVSVDLINGVQKLKDKRIPILIDNCESVTKLPNVDTQIIAARVLKQPIAKLLINGGN